MQPYILPCIIICDVLYVSCCMPLRLLFRLYRTFVCFHQYDVNMCTVISFNKDHLITVPNSSHVHHSTHTWFIFYSFVLMSLGCCWNHHISFLNTRKTKTKPLYKTCVTSTVSLPLVQQWGLTEEMKKIIKIKISDNIKLAKYHRQLNFNKY